ncbi:protein kinase [Asanoa sp. NPDC049573]|uniref:protein kinase domain-containing protein n=1 Tax=Asanoa sp. NPDC049573 TaxID=3155396 RepID=UPI0034312CE3
MFDAGLLVNDRYRLEARIAAGGMGQVWRATDTVLGRTVALKLLRELTDETARARFRNEARSMAALLHPGVAGVYDYGETELPDGRSVAFIVMACVEGQPLSRRIAEAGRLSAGEVCSIVAQAARSLQAVHDAGVVHRDVKPGNLIVEPDGTVVLIDFGVAVTAEVAGHTRADEVVGTALYMAPEQVAKGELTPATDVYALGAVAYHCLAGQPPFTGDNAVAVAVRHLQDEPPALPEDVPATLRHVVATALAKDPALRFPTAIDMADAIENCLVGAATTVIEARAAVPTTEDPLPTPPGRRKWRAAGALLVGTAALLGVLALADPANLLPLPGERARPPAATSDIGHTEDTDPVGGGGGETQSTGGDRATSPAPPGLTPAGNGTGGPAPDGRGPGDGDGVAADGDDPAEPESTPSPQASAPSEPTAPPTSDDDETSPADPDPTTPADDDPPDSASSPSTQPHN